MHTHTHIYILIHQARLTVNTEEKSGEKEGERKPKKKKRGSSQQAEFFFLPTILSLSLSFFFPDLPRFPQKAPLFP